MNFSPQTSGDYAGVLYYQARGNTAPATCSGSANVNSFSGVLYFPAAKLAFEGSGEYNITLIVGKWDLNGSQNVIVDGYAGKTPALATWALVD